MASMFSHTVGSCLTDGTHVCLNIPKNASSAIKATLRGWRYTERYMNRLCDLPGFVVVRDPIARWYSGVQQYAVRHGLDVLELVEQVKAGRPPVFDEHTQRQTDFIVSTFPNLDYVRLGDAHRYISERFGQTLVHRNHKEPLRRDPRLTPVLRRFYSADIELYETTPPWGSETTTPTKTPSLATSPGEAKGDLP